jgi:SecD/SecF fusion protein
MPRLTITIALFYKRNDTLMHIQMEVVTKGEADLAAFRSQLGLLGLGEVALQEFGSANHLVVRVERQAGGEEAQTNAVERLRAEVVRIDPTSQVERTEVVGPKVSDELATAGILSVVLASLAMLIYIWVRFEWPSQWARWQHWGSISRRLLASSR